MGGAAFCFFACRLRCALNRLSSISVTFGNSLFTTPSPHPSNRCRSASDRSSRPSLESNKAVWSCPSDRKDTTGLLTGSSQAVQCLPSREAVPSRRVTGFLFLCRLGGAVSYCSPTIRGSLSVSNHRCQKQCQTPRWGDPSDFCMQIVAGRPAKSGYSENGSG